MAKVFYHSSPKRRRSSHKRKHHVRRHRRLGAVSLSGSSDLVKFGSIAVGYLLSDTINGFVDKATGGKLDSKIVSGGELVAGALVAFGKGKKSMLKSVAGGVLVGAGAKRALKAFNVISGYGAVPVVGGYGSVPVVGGYLTQGTLSGYTPNQVLNGDRKRSTVMGSIDGGDLL